jgi:hypothetical protein
MDSDRGLEMAVVVYLERTRIKPFLLRRSSANTVPNKERVRKLQQHALPADDSKNAGFEPGVTYIDWKEHKSPPLVIHTISPIAG